MSTTTATSLSLKPWTRDGAGEPGLSDVLARLNVERGHFRDITEASLQEELAAEGALEDSSSEGGDEGVGSEGEVVKARIRPTTRQELYAARNEIYTRLNDAHQEVMLSLDMMSLLESKYAPAQGAVTISVALKQAAPVGTMGADVWLRMPQDKAREEQNDLLATNVRVKHLQESADDLLAAATRLQDNVRKETQFWDQILSITDQGWSVSKMRGQGPRPLCVHFGFSGSAPEFSRRDAAALMTDSEGNINLERSIGTRPKAVRAIVKRGKRIIGSSKLPSLPHVGETTLVARIRHARDSLYDEELFHEMIRESRTLTSMGVTIKGGAITFGSSMQNDGLQIEFELVSLDAHSTLPFDTMDESDHFAQAAMLTARLLLGQAHREKIKSKSQLPPPMTEKKEIPPPFSIIRPLMLLFNHSANIRNLNANTRTLTKLLHKVEIAVTCVEAKLTLPTTASPESSSNAESLINSLLAPLTAEAKIEFESGGETSIYRFMITTSSSITSGSVFTLVIPTGLSYDMPCIEDMTSATNEFIAFAVAKDLYVRLGLGWTFNSRDGLLIRHEVGADSKDRMSVSMDDKAIHLILRGSGGTKKVTWEADKDGQSFKDAWQELTK